MRSPTAAQTSMENSVTARAPAMLGLRDSEVQTEDAYHPIIAPSMNTSPCAKLISCRTPYTIV